MAQEKRVHKEVSVHQGQPVRMVFKEFRVTEDLRETKEILETKDKLDPLVLMDLKGIQVSRDQVGQEENRDRKDLLVRWETQAQLDQTDHRDHPDLVEMLVLVDKKEIGELRDRRDPLDQVRILASPRILAQASLKAIFTLELSCGKIARAS